MDCEESLRLTLPPDWVSRWTGPYSVSVGGLYGFLSDFPGSIGWGTGTGASSFFIALATPSLPSRPIEHRSVPAFGRQDHPHRAQVRARALPGALVHILSHRPVDVSGLRQSKCAKEIACALAFERVGKHIRKLCLRHAAADRIGHQIVHGVSEHELGLVSPPSLVFGDRQREFDEAPVVKWIPKLNRKARAESIEDFPFKHGTAAFEIGRDHALCGARKGQHSLGVAAEPLCEVDLPGEIGPDPSRERAT